MADDPPPPDAWAVALPDARPTDEYDIPWKEATEGAFHEFISLRTSREK